MKDILKKLSEIDSQAQETQKKKMITEDHASSLVVAETKPSRLKDMFEAMATKQPIPVVGKEGGTQTTGAGFINVTDTSPAATALAQAVGKLAQDKKLQIVVPTATQQTTKPAAGATGQAPAGTQSVSEKWGSETKVAPSEKGKYEGKSKAELLKQYNALKAKGPHKKGSPDFGKMRELAFAIRAKSGWGKVQEENLDEKITKKTPAGEIISDFEKSKDPKFKGKSKEERKKMALGAYYGMHPEKSKKESVEEAKKAKQPFAVGMAAAMKKTGDEPPLKKSTIKKAHEIGKSIAKKQKVKEAERPSDQVDMGAGLGAGRSPTTLEGKSTMKKDVKDEYGFKKGSDEQGIAKWERDAAAATKAGNHELAKKIKANIDKKKKELKKTVNEGAEHRLSAARLEGRSHGLRGHSHCGNNYEDLEERKSYCEGYKDGLDECYGMGVYEAAPAATVHGMADQALDEEMIGEDVKADRLFDIGEEIKNLADEAMELVRGTAEEGRAKSYWYPHIRMAIDHDHGYMGKNMATIKDSADALMHSEDDEVDEGNAFTAALAKTPKGGKFTVGGKAFTDRSDYDSKIDEFAFESLDNQLNQLLSEGKVETKKPLTESISVSMSTGNQGASDTVNINASDEDAAKLLQLIKQAGLGGFGGEPAHSDYGAPTVDKAHGGIAVVSDHDDMMGMMKKLAGIQAQGGSEDYADEEGSEGTCGCEDAMEEGHTCGEGKEMVDEVETTDQREFQVAEDDGEGDIQAAQDEAEINSSLPAKGGATNEGSHEDEEEDVTETSHEEEEEEDVTEGKHLDEWANNAGKKGTDASFEEDIEFMTKVISGGLNKPKSTGQTTVPVIAGQNERMVDKQGSISATVDDFKKLAGIK